MAGEMPKPLFDAHAKICPQCGSKYSLIPLCPEGLALLRQDIKNAEQLEPVADETDAGREFCHDLFDNV